MTVIPRAEHGISRKQISPNALKVLYRLHEAGYESFLVGGAVRDLLLGMAPKDFDIATSATPDEVRKLFGNCRLIGRRFRLAHVHFGREIIEVATFRGASDGPAAGQKVHGESGRILHDNVYGTLEEDIPRRDITVNALYYNIADFSVHDAVGGLEDLDAKRLRLIGDPVARYREDPVRMLRSVRFAAKLGFSIDPASEKPLYELGALLDDIPPARLFEEVLKLFHHGKAVETFQMLRKYGLFQFLFPAADDELDLQGDGYPYNFVLSAMRNTDVRIQADKSVTPAFLFAVLLWEPMRQHMRALIADDNVGAIPAMQIATRDTIDDQLECISIPKRFRYPVRDIWALQPRLERRGARQCESLLEHPRFRAAYDFLVLRAENGDAPSEIAEWWTDFQELDVEARQAALAELPQEPRRRKRRPRKRSNNNDGGTAA